MKKPTSKGGGRSPIPALACVLLGALAAPSLSAQTTTLGASAGSYGLGQQEPSNIAGQASGTGQIPAVTPPQAAGSAPYPGTVTSPGSSLQGQQNPYALDVPQASATQEISAGDLINVVVFDTPELSGRFRVNAQGDIVLPLVGALHVAGLTSREAADAVTKIYRDKNILLQPQVTVFISELAARGVTMTGEVRSPGIYPIPGPRTLNDMLAMAGGLNADASKTVSIVHRADPTKITTVKLNVGAQTPSSIAASNIAIEPGDTIFVARSGVVYVVGDLQHPGGYQVEHNDRLTILDAVALAGGPTQTSKMWDARLIRRGEAGREELRVDLQKILSGAGPDMLLTDGDILYVPVSQRKVYTRQAVEGIIGVATAYGIFKASQY